MPRALNLLRSSLHYRREAFDQGLRKAGLEVVAHIERPRPDDVLVSWNAYNGFGEQGQRFQRAGATWLVVENGALGKTWRGGEWFSLARGAVALTGGDFRPGGPERWASWGAELAPWSEGTETVVLAQRGIGAGGVRSPDRWAESVRGRIGGRIRQHPGTGSAVPLADDLNNAKEVVTWSSAAAVHALLLGIPVWHAHPAFICARAARPLEQYGKQEPLRDDAARLEAFRRLAWSAWQLDEIRTGEPIARLLGS